MKKAWSLFTVIVLTFTLFGTFDRVKADSDFSDGKIPDEEIESLTGSTLEGYNYIEYTEPVVENYDGTTEVLLGYYEPIELGTEPDEFKPMDNYREYDTWYVYDQGITKSWSYLSNPYFIKSIARGMTYEKTTTVSATISGTFSSDIPNASLPTVKSSFGMTSSGSKTVTEKITLSGPGAGYSSRDFYYQKGRHTHKVKIVQERRSNWDGVLWKKTFYGTVGKPAIKNYSVDRK